MKILKDIYYRTGNIVTFLVEDTETSEISHETIIFQYDVHVMTYYDMLYDYCSEDDVLNGDLAMFVVSNSGYDYDKMRIILDKSAKIFFAKQDFEKIKRQLKPFIAKKKTIKDKTLKIIDFKISGNQMKLYLGDKNCDDYWGDDWNDAPYEYNAGTVYSNYVKDTIVVNFLKGTLLENCSRYQNSPYSKESFKNGSPFAGYLETDDDSYVYDVFNKENIKKFYFNTSVKEIYKWGYLITN